MCSMSGMLPYDDIASVGEKALNLAITRGVLCGCFAELSDGRLQLLAPQMMELTAARTIVGRLKTRENCELLDARLAETEIHAYERDSSFALTEEQRAAIHLARCHRFAVITGGAGVGKTTVLKAIYRLCDSARLRVFQMALAGKAAKRMEEVTERPAMTIAGFLHRFHRFDLTRPCMVVIDEASMLDVVSISRLCQVLPAHVRMLMIGDPMQLMPVGPGLILHALVERPDIPRVVLTAAKRFGSEIAQAAALVRSGRWPEVPRNGMFPVTFLPCGAADISKLVIDIRTKAQERCQVLAVTKNGAAGTKTINTECQARYTRDGTALKVYNAEFGVQQGTGFYLNDLILCTRNRWEFGIPNGLLGKLISINETPSSVHGKEQYGSVLGFIEWEDGELRPLFVDMLCDLELGYAITVHKAQGSQWPVVIVPLPYCYRP